MSGDTLSEEIHEKCTKPLKLYERREFKECMKKQPPGRTFHCLGISSVDERACDGMKSILGGFVR